MGRDSDWRDTKEVVVVDEEAVAARRAVLRRISLFPFGEPQEMPRICILRVIEVVAVFCRKLRRRQKVNLINSVL